MVSYKPLITEALATLEVYYGPLSITLRRRSSTNPNLQSTGGQDQVFEPNVGQDFNHEIYGVSNEASTDIGKSTENAYGSEMSTEATVSSYRRPTKLDGL